MKPKQKDEKRMNDLDPKIQFIVKKLERYALPNDVKVRLMDYYELSGEYSKAEDTLFHLIESNEPDIIEHDKGFYERLLKKTDDDLNSGGSPRSEIEEGLRELEMSCHITRSSTYS
jgi:hypothetical protein